MKKYIYIILAILILLTPSCREDGSFGKRERIKMDKDYAELTAEGGVVTFESQNHNLHLKSVSIFEDGQLLRKWDAIDSKEYPYNKDDWFVFDFPPKEGDKYYQKKLRVEVEANKTSAERRVEFVLHALVHTTTIVVVQKAL